MRARRRKEAFHEPEGRTPAKPQSFSRFVLLFGFVVLASLGSVRAFAESPGAAFDTANRLYEQGKFSDAAAVYEKLVQEGRVSEALYFNWGNALFKSGHIGRAIAAYQTAQQLAPRDPDLRANLQFARNQVQGPTLVPDKLGTWLGRLSLNEWTWASAAGFWGWLLLLTFGQLRPALKPALRPYALWLGLATACMLGCFGAALYFDRGVSREIVIAPETTARQAPLDESQPAFTLHDGAEVEVLDQKDQWLQVQVDQRRIGWVHKEMLHQLREPVGPMARRSLLDCDSPLPLSCSNRKRRNNSKCGAAVPHASRSARGRAVQNLTDFARAPAPAQRPGLRQPSGAFPG